MFEQLKELTPQIAWHMMLENVASMTEGVRSTITRELKPICDSQPLCIDAEIMGHVRRPRLYWLSWKPAAGELIHRDSRRGYVRINNPSPERVPVERFLDPGVTKCSGIPFPTAVRWYDTDKPPSEPSRIEDGDL